MDSVLEISLRNLMKMSRTANGIVDVSASATKKDVMLVSSGDEAKRFHGVVNLNEVAAQMMKYISESSTPEEVHQKLCMDYPEDDPREVGENLCEFLNWLVQQRLLIP